MLLTKVVQTFAGRKVLLVTESRFPCVLLKGTVRRQKANRNDRQTGMNMNNALTGSFSLVLKTLIGRWSARKAWSRKVWRGMGLQRFMLLGVTTLLVGCDLVKDTGSLEACPNLSLIKDANELTRFAGNGRDLTDISFVAKIDNHALDCDFVDDDDTETRRVENRISLRFEAEQGAANPEKEANFSYFVAVVKRNSEVLKREAFDLSIPFSDNSATATAIDTVFTTIPLAPGETGGDYAVYVGFELTRGEMFYNRSRELYR